MPATLVGHLRGEYQFPRRIVTGLPVERGGSNIYSACNDCGAPETFNLSKFRFGKNAAISPVSLK